MRPEDLEHDQAVIGEFLDRVGSAIDERVDARVAAQTPTLPTPDEQNTPSTALRIVSLLSAIPISAGALGTTGGSLIGVLLVITTWVAIVSINVAHTRRR